MAVSIIISTAIYIYFRSIAAAIASFLTGVFIDIDHILDAYYNYGLGFNLKDLTSYCEEIKFKTMTMFFHSYEFIVIFWSIIFLFSLGSIWKAIAIGATQHIVFDQLTNPRLCNMDNRIYFLTFRMINRFKRKRLCKGRL